MALQFGDQVGDAKWNNFGPRVGFAYNPSKNWVVRAGYGIFYYGIMDRTSLGIPAAGFNTSATFSSFELYRDTIRVNLEVER